MSKSSNARTRVFTFTGRVHPERFNYVLEGLPTYTYTSNDGQSTVLKFLLQGSQVIVRAEVNYQIDLLDLKNTANNMARAAIDSFSFMLSEALTLEIVSCVDANGEWRVFNTAFPGFREQGEDAAERELMTFHMLLPHAMSSDAVRLALSDINRAISEPSDTVFHCYRAVESIRQEYALGPNNDKKNRYDSWDRLRQATGVPREEIDWLKDLSERRRHGEPVNVSHDTRARAIKIARTVVYEHTTKRILGANVKLEIVPEQCPWILNKMVRRMQFAPDCWLRPAHSLGFDVGVNAEAGHVGEHVGAGFAVDVGPTPWGRFRA